MDFRKKIRQGLDKGLKGLEFGPSFNPIAPKAEGFNVVTVDHLSRDELVNKYRGEPVELERIEVVDVVWAGQDLRDTLGCGTFDYIIASHVVEHVPCLVSFLQLCQDMLNDTGRLYLLVPDKRFCFDVFRPLASTGLVLDAYFEKRTRPAPYQIFDQHGYSAKCLGSPSWSADTPRSFSVADDISAAFETYQAARSDETYRDVHCWVFVPSSFRRIVSELRRMGLIALGELSFADTKGCEFYLCLSKNAPADATPDRLTLLEGELAELGCYGANNGSPREFSMARLDATLRAHLSRYPRLKLFIKKILRRIR